MLWPDCAAPADFWPGSPSLSLHIICLQGCSLAIVSEDSLVAALAFAFLVSLSDACDRIVPASANGLIRCGGHGD